MKFLLSKTFSIYICSFSVCTPKEWKEFFSRCHKTIFFGKSFDLPLQTSSHMPRSLCYLGPAWNHYTTEHTTQCVCLRRRTAVLLKLREGLQCSHTGRRLKWLKFLPKINKTSFQKGGWPNLYLVLRNICAFTNLATSHERMHSKIHSVHWARTRIKFSSE